MGIEDERNILKLQRQFRDLTNRVEELEEELTQLQDECKDANQGYYSSLID